VIDAGDWNTKIVAEFRANGGKIGGQFEGAPMTVLHHRGRKSGRDFAIPIMYLAEDGVADTIYVFASNAGKPANPQWYYNLIAAGASTVEVGAETYAVQVEEVTGEERDRIFAEQTRRNPGFGDYAEKLAGVRDIPVVALRRR
jgi:deazaflavin-dependent oxidoreductase (nitroreductase family)